VDKRFQELLNLICISGLMYNLIMKVPPAGKDVLLQDAISRDRTTARRAILFNILLQERYLTREQLIVRAEGKLGKGCFGDSAWQDTFYRDMQVVKRALRAAGYHPAYSRSYQRPGYYLRNQPSIGSDLSDALEGSIAEIDRTQILIFKKLTIAQRFRQGCAISNLARQVVAHRIRQRKPQLSLTEAHRLAVQESV
jgi:hypothetical protein